MAGFRKLSMAMLLVILLVSAVACSVKNPFSKNSKDAKKTKVEDIRTGTDGMKVRFLANNPPPKIIVGEGMPNKVDIAVEVVNKGVYPQPEEGRTVNGKLYLSGYDTNIIKLEPQQHSFDLSKSTSLLGKTIINTEGGSEIATFSPSVETANLKVDSYEPSFLATLCYEYYTVAGPSVCIDPDPYSTVKQKKVCEVKDITLTSQGAPIAVIKVEEEAFAAKTQFKVTIKNVGMGDVMRIESSQAAAPQQQSANAIEKCNPFGNAKLTKEDIDKVYVKGISIGDQFLSCWPFADTNSKSETGYIRLFNGEGTIICEFSKDPVSGGYGLSKTAYTTPLKIELNYIYKTTAETKTLLKKEDTGE